MSILVTGGTGYIGSHTSVELLNAGYDIVIVDNFSNSKPEALNRIRQITGKDPVFYEADLLDESALRKVFSENNIDAVIHFAGFKAVGESVSLPLKYYHNNITGTLILCQLMQEFGVKKLVFSSSATVYGIPDVLPVTEDSPLSTLNPYGATKLMIEQILRDVYVSDNEWGIALLRYFNPVGAHESGLLGEDPAGIPNNLMPYVAQVATGKRPFLRVWGNDYPTPDGTGIRDYIHVVDLSLGHLKALEKLESFHGVEAYNLGTGKGSSVMEMVAAFREASGKEIPYQICERRPGDAAESYANCDKAKRELGFEATRTILDMCKSSWNFMQKNPQGL